jgi:transcriptional regulator with XRE-family HTH domain
MGSEFNGLVKRTNGLAKRTKDKPVDVCQVIKQRLQELGLEQRDLATAAGVTESYISQLLTRKKLPPAPGRTDIYDKMGKFLKLANGKLSKLADEERKAELIRDLEIPPRPLLEEMRELVLGKCAPGKVKEVRAIFEKQPFGELERLVTQKLLEVAKRAAKEKLKNGNSTRATARKSATSAEMKRAEALEFLGTDVFNVSAADCKAFLGPLIESWDIDLATFAMEIAPSKKNSGGHSRKFEFVECDAISAVAEEPGFKKFLRDRSLSGDAAAEELDFLKRLEFAGKQPTPLYYYRELQNLRDPLHFRADIPQTVQETSHRPSQANRSVAPMHRYAEASGVERQLHLHARKNAVHRWNKYKTSVARKQKAKS